MTGEDAWRRSLHTARRVEQAARNGVWRFSCLTRSLATWWLLRRQGIGSEVRFGVRKRGEEFQAHAWVEVRGRFLGVEETDAFLAFEHAMMSDRVDREAMIS